MIDVVWGTGRHALTFDRPPYAAPAPEDLEYEGEIIMAAEHFLRPGDIAVDAGASIGYHTCVFSKLVGPDGLVFSFEPERRSYEILMNHVHEVNRLNNVGCLQLALWKNDCKLPLWSMDEIGYSSFHKYINFDESEMVECVTLDGLLGSEHHPRLIKIDCEGTEAEVLLGASKMLARGVDCILLELNYHLFQQTGRDDRIIRQYLHSLGYNMFLINMEEITGGYRPPIMVAPEVPIELRGGHHINVMFSTEKKVRERWKTVTILAHG